MAQQLVQIMKRSKFIRDLCNLVSIQSESYKTSRMMKHISKVVQSIPGCTTAVDDYGNFYVTKGVGPYKCMVCHTDTVHDIVKAKIIPLQVKGNIIAVNGSTMTQCGTGGDDKVGIAITLALLQEQTNMKAVFFLDEEVGCVGSSAMNVDFFSDCLYVLQCDRRGSHDFVNKISGTKLYSKGFSSAINHILQKYHRVETSGGMTDVLEIAYKTKLSVANMSCGYYNPHSDNEYINIHDVIQTYKLCKDIFTYINEQYNVSKKRESYSWHVPNHYFSGYGHGFKTHDYSDYDLTEQEQAIAKVCGSGCGMYQGYCSDCMMTVDEMTEFYYQDNEEYQTKSTSVDDVIQIGPEDADISGDTDR